MSDGVLELNGISEEILSELSYKSKLNISLKSNMHYFPKDNYFRNCSIWRTGMMNRRYFLIFLLITV